MRHRAAAEPDARQNFFVKCQVHHFGLH
jgi:hypothetical protein